MIATEEASGRPGVGLVGVGAMGGAVLAGLRRAGWEPAELHPVVRRPERLAELREVHGVAGADLAAAARADVCVLGVKPAQVGAVLDDLAPLLAPVTVVVSLAAGVTTAAMERRLPAGTAVVRAMPNTASLVGAGTTVVSGGAHAGDEQVALAERVMGAVGVTARVPEPLQDAASALSGSGPAYVFYVVDALVESAVGMGLPRPLARTLATSTVLGAARLLDETGEHPVVLREQVTSPGGSTAAALRVLDEHGVRAAFLAALPAARQRAGELGH